MDACNDVEGATPSQSSVARLSASSIQMFAEAQGFSPECITTEAWKLIWEDLNFRIRHIAYLAQKFMHHSRRRLLTTEHMNKAVRQLKLQPSRGQEHWDAPKLHYMKDPGIYARHEGNVDLVALALAPIKQPKKVDFKVEVDEITLTNELCEIDQKDGPTRDTTDPQPLILMTVKGLRRPTNHNLHKAVSSFLTSTKAQTFVEPFLNFLISQVNEPKCSPSYWLPILSGAVRLLCLPSSSTRLLNKFASTLGKIFLEAIKWIHFDETWDETIWPVAAALRCLNRTFPTLVNCDTDSLRETLTEILKNKDLNHFIHSAALLCVLHLHYGLFEKLEVLTLFNTHYEWNYPVFHSISHFEKGQADMSTCRNVYVGMWKLVVERYIRNLSVVSTHLAAFPNENNPWLEIGNLRCVSKTLLNLYSRVYDVFGGDLIVYRCNTVSHIPVTCHTSAVESSQLMKAFNCEISKDLLSQVEEEAFSGSIFSLIEQDKDVLRETPPSTPKGKCIPTSSGVKRKSTSSMSGGKKRKRKTAENAFESPRGNRFKIRRTDFIFVFHETEAKVILSGPKPISSAISSAIDVPVLPWHNWLRKARINKHRAKRILKPSKNCFVEPLHLNSVIL